MEGDPEIPVLENIEWWTAGQFGGELNKQCDEIVMLCESWPGARLVIEDFKLRQMSAELSPVEVRAIVEWALRPRYFVRQSPSLAMSTVNDDRQKAWGFWLPGQEHARDAIKHAITFLKRKKEQAARSSRAKV